MEIIDSREVLFGREIAHIAVCPMLLPNSSADCRASGSPDEARALRKPELDLKGSTQIGQTKESYRVIRMAPGTNDCE